MTAMMNRILYILLTAVVALASCTSYDKVYKIGDYDYRYETANAYYLEGKYTNVNDTRNYSMSVTLDETVYEEHFPDVPQLPRNTHVVVVITLGEHGIDWTVDVCPYGEYWLYPDFGI